MSKQLPVYFRLWSIWGVITVTSLGCLFADRVYIRYGETANLGSYLRRLESCMIKCCMAAAPSVFTVMTLYRRKILALGVEAGLKSSAQYSGSIELNVLPLVL